MKVGLNENKDEDSEDTPCDERKKTSLQHLKKGSKRVDTIPVSSVMNKSKYYSVISLEIPISDITITREQN